MRVMLGLVMGSVGVGVGRGMGMDGAGTWVRVGGMVGEKVGGMGSV